MLVTQGSKTYVIINQLKGTAHSVFSTLLIKNTIGCCRRDFSVAEALSTCMSCIMRVAGVVGGGEGGHSPVLASTGLCCRSFCGHES